MEGYRLAVGYCNACIYILDVEVLFFFEFCFLVTVFPTAFVFTFGV